MALRSIRRTISAHLTYADLYWENGNTTRARCCDAAVRLARRLHDEFKKWQRAIDVAGYGRISAGGTLRSIRATSAQHARRAKDHRRRGDLQRAKCCEKVVHLSESLEDLYIAWQQAIVRSGHPRVSGGNRDWLDPVWDREQRTARRTTCKGIARLR